MPGLFDRLQEEIDAQHDHTSLSPIDLLDLPEGLAEIIKKIVRRNGMALTDIATELDQSPAEAREMMDALVDKNLMRRLDVQDETWYKAKFGQKIGKSSSSVWSDLDSIIGGGESDQDAPH